jgi:non-catalytic primase subunit PriX-like protein
MSSILDDEIKAGLDFILKHFASFAFPRTISTKTTEGRQVWVNSRAEALARFKQADYLDCRINAYSKHDIIGDPNFVFIDIDTISQEIIDNILCTKFSSIVANPTVLFTGSGYHIYQPIKSICLDKLGTFSSFTEPSRQFLRFAEIYLSDNKCDPNHNPSFKSSMVRVPNSINSKNNLQVKIVQSWDGVRPAIKLMLGSFYAWMLTRQKKQQEIAAAYSSYGNGNGTKQKRKWIEENLLQTALNDCRKTIVSLILAPYFLNIRKLSFEQASSIIQKWLDLCRSERVLDFNPKHFVETALATVSKSGYKPMSLSTLKEKNSAVYQSIFEEKFSLMEMSK